jgi:hypothetical protein
VDKSLEQVGARRESASAKSPPSVVTSISHNPTSSQPRSHLPGIEANQN